MSINNVAFPSEELQSPSSPLLKPKPSITLVKDWEEFCYSRNREVPVAGEVIRMPCHIRDIPFKFGPASQLAPSSVPARERRDSAGSDNGSPIRSRKRSGGLGNSGGLRKKASKNNLAQNSGIPHLVLVLRAEPDRPKKSIRIDYMPIMSYHEPYEGFTGDKWVAEQWMAEQAEAFRLYNLPIPATGWSPLTPPSSLVPVLSFGGWMNYRPSWLAVVIQKHELAETAKWQRHPDGPLKLDGGEDAILGIYQYHKHDIQDLIEGISTSAIAISITTTRHPNVQTPAEATGVHELTLEVDALADDLASLVIEQWSPTPTNATNILHWLKTGKADKSSQIIALEYLAWNLQRIPIQDAVPVIASQSTSANVHQLVRSTMWKDELNQDPVSREMRKEVDNSELRLELRRMWLEHGPRSFHTDCQKDRFIEYLSSWYDVNTRSETYLRVIVTLFNRYPEIWVPSLEQEGHINRVVALINGQSISTRVIQWLALRVFLAMWHHRHGSSNPEEAVTSDCYLNPQSYGAVEVFLSGLHNQALAELQEDARIVSDILPKSMTPIDFVSSASNYLVAISKQQKIEPEVIKGYGICTDPLVCCGARKEYYTPGSKWNDSIRIWVEKVNNLGETS
ncbi:hypothetical protein FRC03_006520 [Tulasnella sp. 419]|nr:hypothetical protein FRC03_006520 [Tulasnella sp. 419]